MKYYLENSAHLEEFIGTTNVQFVRFKKITEVPGDARPIPSNYQLIEEDQLYWRQFEITTIGNGCKNCDCYTYCSLCVNWGWLHGFDVSTLKHV